jgi:MFS family permease
MSVSESVPDGASIEAVPAGLTTPEAERAPASAVPLTAVPLPPIPELMTPPTGPLATLAHGDFRWLLFMQLTSSMREPTIFLTQAWYVTEAAAEGQKLLMLGLLSGLRGLAFLSYTLFGGTFADRFPRTRVLTLSHLVGLASVLLVGGLLTFEPVADGEGRWLVVMLVLFASFGLVSGQDQPTRTAMIKDSVPGHLLSRAITQHQLAMSLALLAAAPLAGLSIERLGFATTYLAAGLGHVAVLLALTRMSASVASDPDAAGESVLANLRAGLAVLRSDEVVRWTVLSTWGVTALGLSVMGGLISAWVSEILDLDASGWGVMVVFWGLGGIVASAWLSIGSEVRRSGLWFLVACALLGVAVLGFSLSRVVLLAFAFNALVGFSHQLVLTLGTTIVQRQVPNRLLGRVTGLLMLAGGLMQITGLGAGLLAQAVGLEVLYPAAGIAILVLMASIATRQRPLREAG